MDVFFTNKCCIPYDPNKNVVINNNTWYFTIFQKYLLFYTFNLFLW